MIDGNFTRYRLTEVGCADLGDEATSTSNGSSVARWFSAMTEHHHLEPMNQFDGFSAQYISVRSAADGIEWMKGSRGLEDLLCKGQLDLIHLSID